MRVPRRVPRRRVPGAGAPPLQRWGIRIREATRDTGWKPVPHHITGWKPVPHHITGWKPVPHSGCPTASAVGESNPPTGEKEPIHRLRRWPQIEEGTFGAGWIRALPARVREIPAFWSAQRTLRIGPHSGPYKLVRTMDPTKPVRAADPAEVGFDSPTAEAVGHPRTLRIGPHSGPYKFPHSGPHLSADRQAADPANEETNMGAGTAGRTINDAAGS
jgi:hypothetical protein